MSLDLHTVRQQFPSLSQHTPALHEDSLDPPGLTVAVAVIVDAELGADSVGVIVDSELGVEPVGLV